MKSTARLLPCSILVAHLPGISETLVAARPAQPAASRGLHYQAYSVLFFPMCEGKQLRALCVLLLEKWGMRFTSSSRTQWGLHVYLLPRT